MNKILLELKKAYGEHAEFREGQMEAVEGILNGKRALVVQKTGWGKSLVYFLATKILRERHGGMTIIISPLIALMYNQIDSAKKLGLNVKTINSSTNREERELIEKELQEDKADALVISPERLADTEFTEFLKDKLLTRINLFVVDEAHCISDWGHDFRPDYRRIVHIIQLLPPNVPVLATTATANDRVIRDIKEQLGSNIVVSRGSLMRESLSIQVIKLDSKEERLAWIAKNINRMAGSGIIYCLTINDCKLVVKWLKENHISCESYYSSKDKEEKDEVIRLFMDNKIKVLVATVAFGMGVDKPDIGFVIHFQKPANIVSYYQQIGRAGRGIDNAYAILLVGKEDNEINRYFIESAFPTEELMNEVIENIGNQEGMKLSELEMHINMKKSKIEKCLNYLLVNGDIYKEDSKYYKSVKKWEPDLEKSKEITAIRYHELKQMDEFINTKDCYMEYIADILNDHDAESCGKCSNCLGYPIFSDKINEEEIAAAQRFIREDFNKIIPRKKWPIGIRNDGKISIKSELLCEEGLVLSNYGDAGWGKMVSVDKYQNNSFRMELVEASCKILTDFVEANDIRWVTNIPSLRRPYLVSKFAEQLAEKLGLFYKEVIQKTENVKCQKELNTSYLQYTNAITSFKVNEVFNGNVLLVDDMVDSRWTFTVCGYLLRKEGSGKVYPFALANSGGKNGDE